MPSRICSTLDCQRVHYAQGRCERCYRRFLRKKKAKAAAVQETPPSDLTSHDSAANPVSRFAEFPGSAGGRAGVERPLTSPAPSLPTEGVASSHLLGFVLGLSGTGPSTTPSVEFGGFRWR